MGLTHPTVGIVGGTGRMGAWMARLLRGRGLEVLCAGRHTELRPVELARRSDVVVVSVPISDTVDIIKEIGPLVPEHGLIMDLASVKQAPVEAMLKYSRSEVVGIHPLFGPEGDSRRGLRIALCPGRGEEGLTWISGIFIDEGYEIATLEPEEHDRMMGLIQGVNHLSTLALALCISRAGFGLEEIEKSSTRTFHERLDRIGSMLPQPPSLFGSLLIDNPHAEDFLEQYRVAVEDLIRITAGKDRGAFKERFEDLRSFFLKRRVP